MTYIDSIEKPVIKKEALRILELISVIEDLDIHEILDRIIMERYNKHYKDIDEYIKTVREQLRADRAKKRNTKYDKNRVIRKYENGMKAIDIAKELRMGRSTVFKIIKESKKTNSPK